MKKFSMKIPEDIQSPRGGETQQIFIGGQNSWWDQKRGEKSLKIR